MQITQFAEEIGLSEVWFGEHHSGDYEIIVSLELMVAEAAERIRRIKHER